MRLLYLTACRAYSAKLREVNNTYRAAIAGTFPGVALGGPGFDAPVGELLPLPEYVRRYYPDADVVFVADPWHNFWDPCPTYPDCPPLYSGIDEVDRPVILESGDSQFYHREIIGHLGARPDRAVAIRALSHEWRFSPDLPPLTGEPTRPPADLRARVFYLPHGAYPEMVEVARGVEKDCDVLFSGSDVAASYPARARIAQALRSAPGIKTRWLPHPSDQPHDIVGPKFWREVARARIAVAGTNVYRNLTMRYLEIPACGTLAVGDAPWPEGGKASQARGEAWAEHMVLAAPQDGAGMIARKILDALADPAALAARTAAAREFVLSRHSFAAEWARVAGEIEQWWRSA